MTVGRDRIGGGDRQHYWENIRVLGFTFINPNTDISTIYVVALQ